MYFVLQYGPVELTPSRRRFRACERLAVVRGRREAIEQAQDRLMDLAERKSARDQCVVVESSSGGQVWP